MSDYVSREEAVKLLISEAKQNRSKAYGEHECDLISGTFRMAKDIIRAIPTVDAVPVVRCKNCKYYEPEGNYKTGKTFDYGYCYHWDYEQGESPNSVDSDDFCSYGERKDVDTP